MRFAILSLSCCALFAVAGCGQSANSLAPDSGTSPTVKETVTPPDPAFILTESPADAVGVGTAHKDSQDDDEVTIVGRIGGSVKPFVEGMAAFTIVDPKLDPCPDDEGCPTPWDYCCSSSKDIKKNIALVKLVSADGKQVAKDARGLLGVKELSTVVIHGKAKRDEKGNLTVVAEKLYVSKQ